MEEQNLPYNPQETLPPINPPAIKMALMIAGMTIAYTLILYLTNQSENSALGWISYLLVVAGLVLATKNYRDIDSKGFITFKRAFAFCFRIILFASIISAIYNYFHFAFIAPDFIENVASKAEEQLLNNPNDMTEEQIEYALSWQKAFMTPTVFAISGLFASLFMGTIASLVVSSIMKKETTIQS